MELIYHRGTVQCTMTVKILSSLHDSMKNRILKGLQ